MSEHKLGATRYWARKEPDSENIVYFTTLSVAATARAEGDTLSVEITQEEYERMVPEEARAMPYDPSQKDRPAPVALDRAVIEKYRTHCVRNMMVIHQKIVKLLVETDITHAERVFVLEMVKHELMSSMMQPQTAAAGPVH